MPPCDRLPGVVRSGLLHSECATAASRRPGRAGGVPPGGESGPAGQQGETTAGLRAVSSQKSGPQGPHAAHHAEGQ